MAAARHVTVGSKNPVKVQAVKAALAALFPSVEVTVEGVDVPSGVPDQPMGDTQTLEGARNRAARCRELRPESWLTFGLEGGCIKESDDTLWCTAWMVALGADGVEGRSRASVFLLPPPVARLVAAGHELGTASDEVFKLHNCKQKGGTVGALTGGALTRQSYYEQPLMLALAPFLNTAMYTTQ